jgi:hypothetical protein
MGDDIEPGWGWLTAILLVIVKIKGWLHGRW